MAGDSDVVASVRSDGGEAAQPDEPHLVLDTETKVMLDELARLEHVPLAEVLAKAVEAYWGQRLAELSNAAYSALRADPQAWHELEQERAAWEATLADGLDDE
jgi:hypothetical protein